MMNYHEFRIGKVDFILWLDTKRHQWKVYRDRMQGEPLMSFTKAKGDEVIRFLEELKRIENNGTDTK